MNNSPTEGEQTQVASQEPTTPNEQVQQSAEQNQETNSREQSQGSVSDDTAQSQQSAEQTQTQQKEGGENQTDDGLAKFAKSQNIDLATASDDVKRLLKVALDNQKAARSNTPSKSIVDATEGLGDGSLQAEVAQLKYQRTTDQFWSADGRDKSLEPMMVDILNEKAEQYGKDYAFNLSRDLDTLYGMAQLKNGAQQSSNVDIEAIRREERESINRQMSAGAPSAHATQGTRESTTKVDADWIRNEYDPRNPEHVKLVDAYYGR